MVLSGILYFRFHLLTRSHMHNEFTAIIEQDGQWYVAYCPEVPGANGQGRTKPEALNSLRDAIVLILEDRREDGLRGVPADAEREVVVIE
jgi:predicted RNase H-like HicB family nuclease